MLIEVTELVDDEGVGVFIIVTVENDDVLHAANEKIDEIELLIIDGTYHDDEEDDEYVLHDEMLVDVIDEHDELEYKIQ